MHSGTAHDANSTPWVAALRVQHIPAGTLPVAFHGTTCVVAVTPDHRYHARSAHMSGRRPQRHPSIVRCYGFLIVCSHPAASHDARDTHETQRPLIHPA